MRSASSRVVTLWITVLCLVASTFSISGLASAQATASSKHKLAKQARAVAVAATTQKAPPPLTSDTWNGDAGDGNWGTAGNWSAGVPSSADAVTIGGASTTVNLNVVGTAGTLTLNTSTDTLNIENNTNLTVDGNIANSGSITLGSVGNGTQLIIGASAVTLSGSGSLTMGNNGNNIITGAAGTDTFTNAQTISGAGNIGNNSLTLVNSGTINATQSTNLTIQTSGGTTNSGTLEATTGSLVLDGGTVTQTGAGQILSTSSSVQLMNGVTISGGTLNTSGSGLIHTDSGYTATLENLTNAGNYQVDNNATTDLVGTITNNGNINLASVGNGTHLVLQGNVTLNGTGTLTMSNNGQNGIEGAAAGDILTVGSGQTISGSGDIGENSMALVNNGVIDANQSTALYIDTSNGTTNNATLEATAGGTLLLYGRSGNVLTNTGGTILAATGSSVQLQNGIVINGGTLNTAGTGLVETIGGNTATLENLTNTGNYVLGNNSQNTLVGTITNNGNINMGSVGNGTFFLLSGNVTLSGSGTLTMSNNGENFIEGASGAGTEVLTNNINISGSGNIGNGQTILVNTTLGTINADQSTALGISPTATSAAGVTNTGLLEATAGGTLNLNNGTYINAVGSTQGMILANGGTVNLNNGATIVGGTLQSENSGVIQNTNTAFLNGSTTTGAVTLVAGTSVAVLNNTTLQVEGSIVNNGNISMGSVGNGTFLEVVGSATASATLSGTGTLTMDNNVNNAIYGAASTNVFTNQETIQGSGDIGDNQLTFVNQGTVNANVSNPLTIFANGGTTNTGTLEATTGGTLTLENYTIANTGGTIQAIGATGTGNGAIVNLENGVAITGGTLTSNQFGSFNVLNTASLSGLTISSGSTVNINNNSALTLVGTILNKGTINENSAGNGTDLIISGNVALNGAGTVNLSNDANNFIYGAASTDVLTVASSQTIQGVGNIGDNQMTLVNNGTIDGNLSNILYIQANGGTTNTGTLEATAGGNLSLYGNTVTNTGAGKIVAGAGSTVYLQGNVTVVGGSLTGSGTYVVNGGGGYATLSGLTNASTVQINNNTELNLVGTIVNNGAINENSAGNATDLILQSNVALNGTGTVTLSNNPNNFIYGAAGTDVLTVGSTQTIQGAGDIGDNQMTLVNNGTIDANQSSTLTVYASGGTTNTGTIEATSGGNLSLYGHTVTNTGAGTIVAGSGSTVYLQGNVTVQGGSLTGTGTFIENGAGGYATLSGLTNASTVVVDNNTQLNLVGTIVNNGTIEENSAGNGTLIYLSTGNVTLSGSGTLVMSNNGNNEIYGASGAYVLTNASTIEGAGNIGENQLTVVNSGTIDANDSTALIIETSGTFNNTGTIEATSTGGLHVESSTANFLNYNGTTTTLTGGSYVGNGGNVYLPLNASSGITTLAASVTEENGGQILNSNDSNANALSGLTSITSAGSLTIGGVAFTDAGAFSNAGSLTILSGEVFKVGTLSQISGNTLTAGTYVLDANLNLTGATQNITTNAANVTLAGGTIENANSTSALANLATNSGKLTLADSTNFTTVGGFSNTGTLTVHGGSTFTTSSLTQISGTTLSGGTYVLGGNLDLSTGTANITTNSAALTLEGGTIENTSNSSNALANLSTNSKSLTLADGANFTTTGGFTNSGTLTVNSGSTFTVLSGKSLSNYHGLMNTLSGGTFVVAGTLAFNAGTTGAIETDSANLTLQGLGNLENTTAGAASTNALVNLATISSTGTFTLADNANFTAAGNFTNDGKLTVNSGSTFALTGTNTLTNLASGTLTGGTYVVGGTLQLTSANGGITTNAATLTLTGTSAKILDGTTNALSSLGSNSGSFTLSGDAKLTVASGNFTNTGTVDVVKGSTLTVPGTGHMYNQTAGTTTIDGTLAGIGGGAIITGGTIQGAGTVGGNLSVGNASGTAATINVGDSGKAGLLSITGKYTQLATGTMTGLVNGTTAGSGYSQLKVTGTAALAGTINFTVATAFQASLTIGETFTVLTGSSVTGTFSNSTIAINGSLQFDVSYTSTGVVLTVAAVPPSGSKNQTTTHAVAQTAMVSAKPAAGKVSRPIMVAGWGSGHAKTITAGGSEWNKLRSWERPVVFVGEGRMAVAAAPLVRVENENRVQSVGTTQVGISALRRNGMGMGGWLGTAANRVPVKIQRPMLPRISR